MEIIEIGAVRIDLDSLEVIDRFQIYIRPAVNPKLTEFCTELTGITQDQVDAAPWFSEAHARYTAWLDETFDGDAWASWGGYDKNQFEQDCHRQGLIDPHSAFAHLNLKTMFAQALGVRSCGLGAAYGHVKQEMIGRHHSGIDDAVNIARLLTLATAFGTHLRNHMHSSR